MVAEYRPRIERAIKHIMDNLERPLSLREVACAAGLSPFYFHRLFSAVAGEPVARFVTRTRLHAAAVWLAYERDRDVTDIGYACGYSSPSNFSKAFSAYYGCSPSALRAPSPGQGALARGKLHRLYGLTLCPQTLYGPYGASLGAPRYVDTPPIPVCGLAAPTGASAAQIAETFRQMIPLARSVGLDLSDGLFGARFEHSLLTTARLRRYHCLVRSWEGFQPPPPLFASTIPGGRYAVFRVTGTEAEAEAQALQAYASWPSRRGVVPAGQYPVEHFTREQYPNHYDYDVWIAVRPRR